MTFRFHRRRLHEKKSKQKTITNVFESKNTKHVPSQVQSLESGCSETRFYGIEFDFVGRLQQNGKSNFFSVKSNF